MTIPINLRQPLHFTYFRKTTCQTQLFPWYSEIKSRQRQRFESHKRPVGANDAIRLGQMEGGIDRSQGTGCWHSWAIFLAESHPQQANTTANKGLPSRESSFQDRERMVVILAFPIQSPRPPFRVTAGEKRGIWTAKAMEWHCNSLTN